MKIILKYLLFTALSLFLLSCSKKKNTCGEDYTLSAPLTVKEGESLTLKVDGYNGTSNTTFLWECPDMTPYNMLSEGRVEDDDNFVIQDFNIQDVGTYNVKIYPGGDDCEPIYLEKAVEMTPKTCTCSDPPATNTLYYDATYEGLFAEESMTANVFNSGNETSSEITFSGNNTFKIFFGRMLPEFSSTYNLIGGINTFWDTFDDSYLDIHFHLNGYNHGFDYWYIEDDDLVYVKRNGDQLSIQFCDVKVYHLGVYYFTISGKFIVTV